MRESSAVNATDNLAFGRRQAFSKAAGHAAPAKNISDAAAVYSVAEFGLAVATSAAVFFAYPFAALAWRQDFPSAALPAIFYGAAFALSAASQRRYVNCAVKPLSFAVSSAVVDNIRAAATLIAVLFLLKESDDLSRAAVLCQTIAAATLVVIARWGWARYAHLRLADGSMAVNRTLILGEHSRVAAARRAPEFYANLKAEGVSVVSLHAWPADCGEAFRRNLAESAAGLSRAGAIDSVALLPGASNEVVEHLVEALAETPLTIYVAPLGAASAGAPLERRFGGLPAIAIANSPLQNINMSLKRALDVIVASTMLFLLAPLFVVVALAISTESRGPIFFRQTRHGFGGRFFKVFKFRSMRVLEDGRAFRQATRNDPRITAVGRFIRSTNIDELPQLFNVLLGDMSLVGPRPHPVALNEDFASRIRRFHRRHNIRPGITGWAQVHGHRGETDTYEKMRARIEHDLWYVDNWSFALDLRILVSTLFSPAAYRNAG